MANLSEKELSFLEDQLNAEQLLIKKFKAIAAAKTENFVNYDGDD